MPTMTTTHHTCPQCGPIRPRAVAGEDRPYHDPAEGGCGAPITEAVTERAEPSGAPDPGLADRTQAAASARFQLTLERGTDGQLTARLGARTFTDARALWAALDANLSTTTERQAERRAKLAAEREAELAQIDKAIAEGKRERVPAKAKPRTTAPATTPDLNLSDLGL